MEMWFPSSLTFWTSGSRWRRGRATCAGDHGGLSDVAGELTDRVCTEDGDVLAVRAFHEPLDLGGRADGERCVLRTRCTEQSTQREECGGNVFQLRATAPFCVSRESLIK